MKKLISALQNRIFLLITATILNAVVFSLVVFFNGIYFYLAVSLLVFLLFLTCTPSLKNYKLTLSLLVFIMPLVGLQVYLFSKPQKSTKKFRLKWHKASALNTSNLSPNTELVESLIMSNPYYSKVALNINTLTNMPVYNNSKIEYLENIDKYKNSLFASLNAAKKSILIEVSKIKEGKLWDEIFNILKQKSLNGVEIRIMYDEKNCLNAFSQANAFEKLINHGIKVLAFNKVKLFSTSFRYSRNNRNMIIIDDYVVYSSTIDITDKHIFSENSTHKASDALKIMGECVWSYIVLFFNNWMLFSKEIVKLQREENVNTEGKSNIYSMSYASVPFHNENINKNILLSMLSVAKKSVLITQPYLIIDNEIKNALKVLLRSGVTVKILVSSKVDSDWKRHLSLSNLEELVKERLEVYEYSEGYLNSNFILTDEKVLLYGGGMHDIRGSYHDFELSTLVINDNALCKKIVAESDTKIGTSQLLTLKDLHKRSFISKIIGRILQYIYPVI